MFKSDLYRITGKKFSFNSFIKIFLNHHEFRFLLFHRMNNIIGKFFSRIIIKKYGLEIYTKKIGYGLLLLHPFNITVNGNAIIGNNCTLCKGCTIGQEDRGKRKGVPVIGDFVWIGANATIVGNISVGNNVLIAPNSFVNFDVPDNSIVLGNPAKIIYSKNATKDYLYNIYDI